MKTFRTWLQQKITATLKPASAAFLIWCDPQQVWQPLLQTIGQGQPFEVWATPTHELLLRQQFYQAPPMRRLVWLPVDEREIGYFKVFALQAEAVWQPTFPELLSEFGVNIPAGQVNELASLLPSHTQEWLDHPLQHWKENLSLGQVKTSLLDDDLFLQILATNNEPITSEKLTLLQRRAVEDFGLPPLFQTSPPPEEQYLALIEKWRLKALAALLMTNAAANQGYLPPTGELVIDVGPTRQNALDLLARWQKRVDLLEQFERLAPQADKQTMIAHWAKQLDHLTPPLASPLAEKTLFEAELNRLTTLDGFEAVTDHLAQGHKLYQAHAQSFWGQQAQNPVPWAMLVKFAEIATLLQQHRHVENQWQTPQQAIVWFTESGWQIDQASETLFAEHHDDLPPALIEIRAQLRRASLRHLDRTNTHFAELVAHHGLADVGLPFAGTLIHHPVKQASARNPVAVIVLDACRYELGQRLAQLLNQGELQERATVAVARAPLPTITPLGMPHALPGLTNDLQVALVKEKWQVTTSNVKGNLVEAGARRDWLKQQYKLKDTAFLAIEDVVDTDKPQTIKAKSLGKLLFVFEGMLDDHDQILRPFGLNQVLDRYTALIRRLRSGGYNTILVVTDHGFFHWDPAPDEHDLSKPEGTILWRSRRAIVGQGLQHESALTLPVSNSDTLQCAIPRSIQTFKTYGRLGFFHGGATLQELVIPVLTITWPKKAEKIGVVLKPMENITSETPRLEIASAHTEQDMFGQVVNQNLLARQVQLKIINPKTGQVIFKAPNSISIEPGRTALMVELTKVDGIEARYGTELEIQARDADDETILDHRPIKLMIDIDEW
ncbi:PglZ domain-containing protein [Anaerolineales bacterium HSG25]|nr:PglZ domain-containing protein [Anaerolineales bacterium HSG25]